jgi:hypothetical protein
VQVQRQYIVFVGGDVPGSREVKCQCICCVYGLGMEGRLVRAAAAGQGGLSGLPELVVRLGINQARKKILLSDFD